jgi:CO/xanthine dehydrogenase Mo-binding subunit
LEAASRCYTGYYSIVNSVLAVAAAMHEGGGEGAMTEDGIGVPLRRREDRRFLTGRGRYVHDIVRPRQLHAVFLRSPHAHAEIVAIEKAEALASPDVAAIFTAEDVAADKLNPDFSHRL